MLASCLTSLFFCWEVFLLFIIEKINCSMITLSEEFAVCCGGFHTEQTFIV